MRTFDVGEAVRKFVGKAQGIEGDGLAELGVERRLCVEQRDVLEVVPDDAALSQVRDAQHVALAGADHLVLPQPHLRATQSGSWAVVSPTKRDTRAFFGRPFAKNLFHVHTRNCVCVCVCVCCVCV